MLIVTAPFLSPRAARSVARVAAVLTLLGPALSSGQAPVEDLDTPFVITPTNVVTAMLDLAKVAPGDRLIDLGSGDGRIVIAAAQRGATGVGIEIDANLVERSRESARRLKLEDRTTFVAQDLFETDFSGYDVVTLYLLAGRQQAARAEVPRTLAARNAHRVARLRPWRLAARRTIVVDAPDKPVNVEKKSRIYYWLVPARVAGSWEGLRSARPSRSTSRSASNACPAR